MLGIQDHSCQINRKIRVSETDAETSWNIRSAQVASWYKRWSQEAMGTGGRCWDQWLPTPGNKVEILLQCSCKSLSVCAHSALHFLHHSLCCRGKSSFFSVAKSMKASQTKRNKPAVTAYREDKIQNAKRLRRHTLRWRLTNFSNHKILLI